MDSNFWDSLASYQKDGIFSTTDDNFVSDLEKISKLVREKIYSEAVIDSVGDSIFSRYVGSDDGHDDLCDFIIWNGKEVTNNFLSNPRTVMNIARTMSQTKGFDGDINILRKLAENRTLVTAFLAFLDEKKLPKFTMESGPDGEGIYLRWQDHHISILVDYDICEFMYFHGNKNKGDIKYHMDAEAETAFFDDVRQGNGSFNDACEMLENWINNNFKISG